MKHMTHMTLETIQNLFPKEVVRLVDVLSDNNIMLFEKINEVLFRQEIDKEYTIKEVAAWQDDKLSASVFTKMPAKERLQTLEALSNIAETYQMPEPKFQTMADDYRLLLVQEEQSRMHREMRRETALGNPYEIIGDSVKNEGVMHN